MAQEVKKNQNEYKVTGQKSVNQEKKHQLLKY